MINIGILQFPGSNCERETSLAIARAGMNPVPILWTSNSEALDTLEGFILIGGFSFEDRIRAGIIAAKSTWMQRIIEQVQLGKPVVGICNGAQILIESGLVPGYVNSQQKLLVKLALDNNLCQTNETPQPNGYFNDWCYIKSSKNNYFAQKNTILNMPFAHAQGRFVIDKKIENELINEATSVDSQLCIWQYCDIQGNVHNKYPINPNGSYQNIAAISNFSGNVLAIMPHPERTPLADSIFINLRKQILKKSFKYYTRSFHHDTTQNNFNIQLNYDKIILTKLDIQDNEADSAQQVLKQLGYNVELKKWVCWQIDTNAENKQTIINTQALYNSNKETLCKQLPSATHLLLVTNKTDIKGTYLSNYFKKHYDFNDNDRIRHGTLWSIEPLHKLNITDIINQNILHNPISQQIYSVEI